jgi:hypothetical protein
MNKSTAIIIMFISLSTAPFLRSQSLTAREIVKKSDDKVRGSTSQGEMTMTIVRPDWTRSVSMKSWSRGSDYAMILITSPVKDKGQVFLKIKTDMWNWMPSIDKMIKIPPSMMMQSWMGSDFTNDDLVRESSIVKDYTHKLIGKEPVRGEMCYIIEMIPFPDAPVTWGKILLWITIDGYNQWKAEYYDEDMELVNTLDAYDIKKMGDRDLPVRMEISPVDKQGQKTVLETKQVVFDQPIGDDFFTQQNMKKLSQTAK